MTPKVADGLNHKGDQKGSIRDNTERKGRGYIENKANDRGRTHANTDRKGGGYTEQWRAEGGASVTIQRAMAEAIQNNGDHMGRIRDNA